MTVRWLLHHPVYNQTYVANFGSLKVLQQNIPRVNLLLQNMLPKAGNYSSSREIICFQWEKKGQRHITTHTHKIPSSFLSFITFLPLPFLPNSNLIYNGTPVIFQIAQLRPHSCHLCKFTRTTCFQGNIVTTVHNIHIYSIIKHLLILFPPKRLVLKRFFWLELLPTIVLIFTLSSFIRKTPNVSHALLALRIWLYRWPR